MATATVFRRASEKTKPGGSLFRADIQGLRAVAVIAVILDHLLQWPSGGFVGVDVFFVISGFLITGFLLKEHTKTGRISFVSFYRRRAKRILPLAVAVLLCTVAASYLLYGSARFRVIAEDSIWSLFFGANWHFALIGTDYMNAGSAVSPVQHFWSLAVEEQFYLVWPWLIVLVLGVAASRLGWTALRSKRVLQSVMLVVTVAFFTFSVWETANAPTVAYFSTFSRAWELGIGAMIAVSVGVLAKIPELVRTMMAYLGMVGIAGSLFIISSASEFPGPWAALPVGATALVIAAGCGGQQRFLAPLTNRVMRYVGDISYSLYLWHFPLIVVLGSIFPMDGWVLVATLATIFAISSVSFHLLEDPIRKSSWLEPQRVKRSKEPIKLSPLPYVGLLAVVALLVGGGAVWRDASLKNENQSVAAARIPSVSPTGGAPATALQSEQAKVQVALASAEWPSLTPSIDSIGPESKASEWVSDGCLALDRAKDSDPIANAQHCVYGDAKAPKTAVILGDSMAISYAGAIREALVPQGYRVLIYTMQECPAVSVDVIKGDGSAHPQCSAFRNWALSQIESIKPDLVFASSARSGARRLASGAAEGSAANAEWAGGAKVTFTRLVASARKVIALDPPPGGKNLQECATKISKPSNCTTTVDAQYTDIATATRDGAANAPNGKTVLFPDVQSWFCAAGVCPAFAGSSPIYADTGHITSAFSKSLAPLIKELVN